MISPSLRLSLAALAVAVGLAEAPAARADFSGLCHPNQIVAGPTSGPAAVPFCRQLVAADIPPAAIPLACANITAFGAVGNGVTDVLPAWTAAIALSTNHPCIYFPPGKYLASAQLSYTYSADKVPIAIIGAADGTTEITWPNANGGFLLTMAGEYNAFTIANLTLSTGQNGSGTAIAVNQPKTTFDTNYLPQNYIQNVTIRGADGWGKTNFWNVGGQFTAINYINFLNVTDVGPLATGPGGYSTAISGGNGIILTAPRTNQLAVSFNFTGCTFEYLGNGILYGQNIQGVTVYQTNFTGNFTGIGVPSGAVGVNELIVGGSQFNDGAYDINLLSAIAAIQITNSLFIHASPTKSADINVFNAGGQTLISGNVFQGFGIGTAVIMNSIGTSGLGGLITGNAYSAYTLGNSLLGTGSNVQSNAYASVTTMNSNCGANGNVCGGGSQ